MNVGAFAVVSHFAGAGEKYVTLEDYAGLGRKSPALAATFTFFLMSLIGIPITGDFFAKFYVLSAALKSNLVVLAIILVLNSAVGAYYYLRIIVMMYMREPQSEVIVTPVPASAGLAITVCVLLTLYLGVLPGPVLDYAAHSARQLIGDAEAPTASAASRGRTVDGVCQDQSFIDLRQGCEPRARVGFPGSGVSTGREKTSAAAIDNRHPSGHY
jgi:formate hydrogenlyase subunit 3/multisubunit Na+/H+ antiporter MnhD subunit